MGQATSKKSRHRPDSPSQTQSFLNSSSDNFRKKEFYSNDILSSTVRPIQTTSPLIMPILQTFKCDQCGMVFPTDESLFKHRTRFCIGVRDSGIGRQLYYTDDEQTNAHTNRSTFTKFIQPQSASEKVIFEYLCQSCTRFSQSRRKILIKITVQNDLCDPKRV